MRSSIRIEKEKSIMKWNTSSFLENRLFDSRLTKSALMNKWRIDDDIYKQRMDYRHFKETYVHKLKQRLSMQSDQIHPNIQSFNHLSKVHCALLALLC